jgi:hypothetical protein
LNQNPIFEMGSGKILALKKENDNIDTTGPMLQPE